MDALVQGVPAANVWFADTGCAIATRGNLFVNVMREAQTLERLREVRRHIERHVAAWGTNTISISVLEPGATAAAPKEVRDETAAITRDYGSIAAAIVIEGSGFRAAAVRAVVAAIYLVSHSPYPHKIVESVDDGARWLRQMAERAGQARVGALEIVDAVAAARAELRRA
ncbi:MAG TPA: hypothetical protein VFF06_33000 [Polyangia bacterium]|nr:hypothetical protein [Polyangia bacterium]